MISTLLESGCWDSTDDEALTGQALGILDEEIRRNNGLIGFGKFTSTMSVRCQYSSDFH